MEQAIKESGLIISRSGYSTIMDLSVLGKKAVFVPTPGQTEQEYLGHIFNGNRQHLLMLQRDFNLEKAWKNSENFSGFPATTSQTYMNHLERFINGLS
jgi:UDP-N-acetylglucosamine:LPS N-acetylglucosamine transferase